MTITGGVIEDVCAHAREARPRECCGMLVGRAGHVVRAVRARNLAESANRFLIDPRDHIAAIRQARSEGLAVVGFYHSHPHSRAYPSTRDLEGSHDEEAEHLIVGFHGTETEVRAFRLRGAEIEETGWVVIETGPAPRA